MNLSQQILLLHRQRHNPVYIEETKVQSKIYGPLILFFTLIILPGCTMLPSPTPTVTPTPTSTPAPTATNTPTQTPKPSVTPTETLEPTNTMSPLPTSSQDMSDAVDLTDHCKTTVSGLEILLAGVEFPERFINEDYSLQSDDFNPNQYFSILTHLKMEKRYTLDFVYFGDELGGLPLVYARKSGSTDFQTYEEFLKSFGEEQTDERSYSSLPHAYDYLQHVQVDGTPESFLEYVILSIYANQFYLSWHGLYNDGRVLCDNSYITVATEEEDISTEEEGISIESNAIELPEELVEQARQIDFTPSVFIDGGIAKVRTVYFTNWGGFIEDVYEMDFQAPYNLLDARHNTIVEYDCGGSF
jgi:hypothetical protein